MTGASSKAVEPEVATVEPEDVLSEVDMISLGSAGSSGEKKRLEDEAEAISLDSGAGGCAPKNGLTILAGELGIEISISDLNRCKWDHISVFNEQLTGDQAL
jgi:hypothetical protein